MTRTVTTATNVGEYYDKLLLDNLYPNMYLYQLGEKRRVPRGTGKVVHWTRYFKGTDGSGFDIPYTITEGTPVGLSNLSTAMISATLAGLGTAVGISDFIVMVGVSDMVKGAVFELSKSMALAIERKLRTALSTVGNRVLAAGVTATALYSTMGTNSLINSADLMRMVARLRQADARTYPDGLYATVMHPRVAFDLRNDATAVVGWSDINRTTGGGQDRIYHGEVGSLYGTRVIESSEAKQMQAGDTPEPSLYKISAGTSGFLTQTFGPGGFGVVELDGATSSVYVKQVGSAGSADAINQIGSVGVKTYFASATLDANRITRATSGGASL